MSRRRIAIPAMIHAAIQRDVEPMLAPSGGCKQDLSEFGILPIEEARDLMKHTVETVVLPGLHEFGV